MSGRSNEDGRDASPLLTNDGVAAVVERVDGGRVALAVLAVLAAAITVLVDATVFPYRSLNHDEGVYLQQAELLQHGRLFFRPPVDGPFRPWFFVESPDGLYSKYSPVPAVVFTLGRWVGGYTLALAAVAATLVGGVVALGRELFDTRVGVLAGCLLLATPLFVVHSGLYLPYALTTTLNVVFALAYLRAERRGSVRDAALAGVAVGLAAFTRPYTAALFALPFVAHAVVSLLRSRAWRAVTEGRSATDVRALLGRRLVTGLIGAAGVSLALAYNLVTTGDPLVFPYLAFAPNDGIGFGRRTLLGHSVEYTPRLALRANALVLDDLFTEWVVAGPLGSLAALVGVALTLGRGRASPAGGDTPRRTRRRGALLAATFVTVAAGNLAFWGNYNVLGSLAADDDGLVHYLGPYYHFDLVVPVAVFAAVTLVAGVDWLRATATNVTDRRTERTRRQGRAVVAVVVLVCGAVVGGVSVVAVDRAVEPNADVTEELRAGYEPFAAGGPPDDSVVFLPTPYGPWLNHPFQTLRNDAEFGGRAVYALGDTRELAVAAAFPDRDLYRYVYAGTWVPTDDSTVRGAVVPVERVSGERVTLDVTLPRPEGVSGTTVRVSTAGGSTYLVDEDTEGPLSLSAVVTGDRLSVSGETLAPSGGDGSLTLDGTDEVVLEVFVSTGPAGGFSYQVVFPVERTADGVRALSPTVERCSVPSRCVPPSVGGDGDDGVNVTLTAGR